MPGLRGNFCFWLLTVSHQTSRKTDFINVYCIRHQIFPVHTLLVLVTVFCDVCILFKMGLGLQSYVKVINDAVTFGHGQYHVLSKLLP